MRRPTQSDTMADTHRPVRVEDADRRQARRRRRPAPSTNINPATEEVLGEVADASKADMHRAIDAARRAFDETDWSTNHALPQAVPASSCRRRSKSEQEELREELILEVGCPRMITHGPQLDAPLADALRYPAKLIDEYPWETRPRRRHGSVTGMNTTRKVWREPVGVVGAIVPWNFPFEVTIHKLGQALATGNTVVLKPAPDTPCNATRLGRLIAEKTDIPPGVVNVVTASDHLVGEELTLSPKVDLISFTGSTAVGKRIMEKGAATMKRLFLELGGKSATIVLDDADFALALHDGHRACACTPARAAPSRRGMLLPRSRYDEGVELLKRHVRGRRLRRSAATRRTLMRPGHLGQAARAACSATSRRASTKAPSSSSAAAERPTGSTRATSSSRRCSSTSTTR